MKPTISLFGNELPLYGVFCVIGIAVAAVIAIIFAKKQGYEFFDFMLVAIIVLISAFIGAKVLAIIVSFDSVILIFKTLPFFEAFTTVFQGGFVFYGGLIGGTIGLFITLKIKKIPFCEYASLYAMVLTIGHAFGRVGCFFSGCCYGMEYDGFLSYAYTEALDPLTPIGVKLLPVQLIEAFFLTILFVVLLFLYIKLKNKKLVTFVYALAYPVIRFTLEFFRGDQERGAFLGISTSQWISLIIFFTAIGIFTYMFIKSKKSKVVESKESVSVETKTEVIKEDNTENKEEVIQENSTEVSKEVKNTNE